MKDDRTEYRAWLTELETLIPSEQVLGFLYEPIDGNMKHDKILYYSNLPLKGGYSYEKENSEYYILQQYTRKKDKHGIKIFEGDVVNGCSFNGSYAHGKVVWDDDRCGFLIYGIGKFIEGCCELHEYLSFIEVIGHIYSDIEKENSDRWEEVTS